MTIPDFTFNEKTGELSRGGKLVSLCRLHAQIFGALVRAQGPISPTAIERAIGAVKKSVYFEIAPLARRIRPLGISIESGNRQRWLSFGEVPKWKPKIPDPVRLEGERP